MAAPVPAESSAGVISLLFTWRYCWALLTLRAQPDGSKSLGLIAVSTGVGLGAGTKAGHKFK